MARNCFCFSHNTHIGIFIAPLDLDLVYFTLKTFCQPYWVTYRLALSQFFLEFCDAAVFIKLLVLPGCVTTLPWPRETQESRLDLSIMIRGIGSVYDKIDCISCLEFYQCISPLWMQVTIRKLVYKLTLKHHVEHLFYHTKLCHSNSSQSHT